MIQNVLSIVVALGLLITFHEFGHYYVARRCGVKVLRFSVGFGKPIYRWVNKAGTEFTLAMIPLGGYVRMLDEREGDVPDSLRQQTFNSKSVGQRFAIVAAGPIANFILAAIIYALVAMLGLQTLVPKVGDVIGNSPAAQTNLQAGDEITRVGDHEVQSWEEINLALADLIGQSGRYTLRYIPAGSSYEEESSFNLERWLAGAEPSDLISEFGIQPWQPVITPVISDVVEGGAAEAAGFRIGDTVTAVNGTAIYEWQEFVVWVQKSPGVTLKVELLRDGEQQTLTLVPASREQNGVATGFAGLAVAAPELTPADVRDRTFGVFGALEYGVTQTWKMVSLTISSIGKMLQGLIAIDNLSGPITIAKVASASADSGLQSFLKFMAYLSVSLGVLNLLPIPMLDGGHLVFFTIEAIRRRPVSERIQALAYRVGASLLFAMMAVAIFNDIARL